MKVLILRDRQVTNEHCKQSRCVPGFHAIQCKTRCLKLTHAESYLITSLYSNFYISLMLSAWPFPWDRNTWRGKRKGFYLHFPPRISKGVLKIILMSGDFVPLTSKRGCRMMVPLFMKLVFTLQILLGLIVLSGLKQPHLGWPMTSFSVHLQIFFWSCSTRVCYTPALVMDSAQMCYRSIDLCPGRCLKPRARLPTSRPCSPSGAMRWTWSSGPKAVTSTECAPKHFVGKQQKVLSWSALW